MCRSICSLLLLLVLWSGCSRVDAVPKDAEASKRLTRLLLQMERNASVEEAQQLSYDIITRAALLERTFDRTTTPWMHNFMVNVGLKQKGLCYQYADGLYGYLRQRHYPHFRFHLAGAHIGEYWREHNTLVITAKNGKVQDGIVVDPWREQGKVFVSLLQEDKAYNWVHRPKRE